MTGGEETETWSFAGGAVEVEAAVLKETAGSAETTQELRIEPIGLLIQERPTPAVENNLTYQVIVTRRVTSKQRPERTAEPNGRKSQKEKEKKKEKKQALLEVALRGPRSTGHNGSSSSVGFGQKPSRTG